MKYSRILLYGYVNCEMMYQFYLKYYVKVFIKVYLFIIIDIPWEHYIIGVLSFGYICYIAKIAMYLYKKCNCKCEKCFNRRDEEANEPTSMQLRQLQNRNLRDVDL